MEISSSKKRKECLEFDEEEEEKMDKFYELIRSFRDHASHLFFTSRDNVPKNIETTQPEIAEKIDFHQKKKKKKKIDDKEKEGVKSSSNHEDLLMFASPSQATTRSSPTGTTRNSTNSDGTTLGVNVTSDYKVQKFSSGDQIHDDTQGGLDLNLSL